MNDKMKCKILHVFAINIQIVITIMFSAKYNYFLRKKVLKRFFSHEKELHIVCTLYVTGKYRKTN